MEAEEKNKIQIINFIESSEIAQVYDGKNTNHLANITKKNFIEQLEQLQHDNDVKKIDSPMINKNSYTFPIYMNEGTSYFVNVSKNDSEYFNDLYELYISDKLYRKKQHKGKVRHIGKIAVSVILITATIGVGAKIGEFYRKKDAKMIEIGRLVNEIMDENNGQISREEAYAQALERINAKIDDNNENTKGIGK